MPDIDRDIVSIHFNSSNSEIFDIVVQRYDSKWMFGIRTSDSFGSATNNEFSSFDIFTKGARTGCMINTENVDWIEAPKVREIENGVAHYHRDMAKDDIEFEQLIQHCVGKLEVNSLLPHLSKGQKERNRRRTQREKQRHERNRTILERILGK